MRYDCCSNQPRRLEKEKRRDRETRIGLRRMSTSSLLLLSTSLPNRTSSYHTNRNSSQNGSTSRLALRFRTRKPLFVCSSKGSQKSKPMKMEDSNVKPPVVDCVGTGTEVECYVVEEAETKPFLPPEVDGSVRRDDVYEEVLWRRVLEWAILISPFFFWGTAMVAMKEVIPKTGPFFVSAVRLVPAGMMLIGFAAYRGRKHPSGLLAWLSIFLFGIVDAACFQGFLAEGLQRTSAGLGSVIIDSQPLTVAILASILFGESIGLVGVGGLVLGVIGLLLLEVPAINHEGNEFSIWGSGEWWMLLAAQSMAIGTVMVRWVSKYSDPVMATGWHMIIGGLPLLVISVLNHDPAFTGSLSELTPNDVVALLYTSVFGSAVSYGVFFYNATRGSLTQLSSFTFLTPMFASIFGYLFLGETFAPLQLGGAFVTLLAIYMVNYRGIVEKE